MIDAAQPGLARLVLGLASAPPAAPIRESERAACFHCGEPCPDRSIAKSEKFFCCQGCLFVHELLTENGLQQFYDLNTHPGVRVGTSAGGQHWNYLDEPNLQARLLDFTDGKTSRVTFHIPAIHCVACVWLLENLFRLLPGLGPSRVNFPRREVCINYAPDRVRLSRIVALLVSIGYEPELNFGQLDKPRLSSHRKRLWLQIGLAGFSFGNIMLFSLPTYLGLDKFSGPAFKTLFGYLSLVLAAPVLVYSASDYWRAAWLSFRQRMLTLEVPIALGLAALYAQSTVEIVSGRGEGYADSLAGLVFFLLCGRAFQQKTHDRIIFDRDYKSFFPLSVSRSRAAGEQRIGLSELEIGDRLIIRNGELIPADATLVSGAAFIDYSFVTGESEPVPRQPGDRLYAGGQQVGGAIEIQIVKPVSQSYLASLWSHEAFQKERPNNLNTLTNRYGRQFTRVVIAVAAGAALFWSISGDPARGLKAFTSVLIVACPCALALAAPFALGTAQRALAGIQVFLKGPMVLERLAEIDTIVFDKTGTLTTSHSNQVAFISALAGLDASGGQVHEASFESLTPDERLGVRSLAAHSTHPHARRIAEALQTWDGLHQEGPLIPDPQPLSLVDTDASKSEGRGPKAERRPKLEARTPKRTPSSEESWHAWNVSSFSEVPGRGIQGRVQGRDVCLGSRTWLEQISGPLPPLELPPGSVSCLSIDGRFRGAFVLENALRPDTDQLVRKLGSRYELALLSGDNEKERTRFQRLFGRHTRLHFNQSPLDKLGFIKSLQNSGKAVLMAGDGLNDAGALKQSDVGVAVVEKVGVFSPASDIILEAKQVRHLGRILDFARSSTRVIQASIAVSAVYNLVGISIAAAGIMSPLICAVLMPLSSLSVVLFACGMTSWVAKPFRVPHCAFRT